MTTLVHDQAFTNKKVLIENFKNSNMTDNSLATLESELLEHFRNESLLNPIEIRRISTKKYLQLGIEYIGLPSAVDYVLIRISRKTGMIQAHFSRYQLDGARRMIRVVRCRWFRNRRLFCRKIRKYLLSDMYENKIFRFFFERKAAG